MHHTPASLLELTLVEQEARHAAALAAIRSRAADIRELETFATALSARALHVRPAVTTRQVGAAAACDLHLWTTCSSAGLGEALHWISAADIGIARLAERDRGNLRVYRLTLRGFDIELYAQVNDYYPTRGCSASVAREAA